MKFFHRSYLGVAIGFIVTTLLLSAGGIVWFNQVSAQNDKNIGSCFLPAECVGSSNITAVCKTAEGCCTGDRCFKPVPACDALGDVKGAGHCYAKSKPVRLIVPIGGRDTVLDLGDYLAAIYTYSLSIAGILATILMMVGGFQYLTGQPKEGRERILQAIGGMLITFLAYLILQTVNPALVVLKLPQVQVVKRVDFVLCEYAEKLAQCGLRFGIKQGATAKILQELKGINDPNLSTYIQLDQTKLQGAEIVATCNGRGCKAIGGNCTNDTQFKCTTQGSGEGAAAKTPICSVTNPTNAFCAQCQLSGTACEKSSDCCGGGCFNKVCHNGVFSDPCNSNSECQGGLKCVKSSLADQVLQSIKLSNVATGQCAGGGSGQLCNGDLDCFNGYTCTDNWYNNEPSKPRTKVCVSNRLIAKVDADKQGHYFGCYAPSEAYFGGAYAENLGNKPLDKGILVGNYYTVTHNTGMDDAFPPAVSWETRYDQWQESAAASGFQFSDGGTFLSSNAANNTTPYKPLLCIRSGGICMGVDTDIDVGFLSKLTLGKFGFPSTETFTICSDAQVGARCFADTQCATGLSCFRNDAASKLWNQTTVGAGGDFEALVRATNAPFYPSLGICVPNNGPIGSFCNGDGYGDGYAGPITTDFPTCAPGLECIDHICG